MKLRDMETGEIFEAEPVEEAPMQVLYEPALFRNGPGRAIWSGARTTMQSGRRPRPSRRPGTIRPRYPSPRGPAGPIGPAGPVVAVEPTGPVHDHGDYVAIKKDVVAELVPIIGKAYASFLARPEPPSATGDNIVDRDNASMHRDALALHQQNQTRILALTDLVARAAKLFL